MNLTELEAAGLYDPSARDAEERRVLLARAIDAGAELDDLRLAVTEGWLHVLPVRLRLLGADDRMDLETAAARAGVDAEFAHQLWQALGIPRRPGLECSPGDLAMFAWFAQFRELVGDVECLRSARAHGTAVAQLADAEITQLRSAIEAPQRAAGAGNVDVGSMLIDTVTSVLPPLQAMLLRLHVHHLMAAGRRYSLWGRPPLRDGSLSLVVGFADLVGFTALGNTLNPDQLDALLHTFEARAVDTATGATTRLVKLIGDEAMFVAGDAEAGLAVAQSLIADSDLPPMRVGLASGQVITRGGDVFGGTVNRAARIVAIAEPGEILLDAPTATALQDAVVAPRGPHVLPGFSEPVEIFAVS